MVVHSPSPVSLKLHLWHLENRKKNGEMIAQAAFLHFSFQTDEHFQDLAQHIGTITIMREGKRDGPQRSQPYSGNHPGLIPVCPSPTCAHLLTTMISVSWKLSLQSLPLPKMLTWLSQIGYLVVSLLAPCPFKPFAPGTGVMVLKRQI